MRWRFMRRRQEKRGNASAYFVTTPPQRGLFRNRATARMDATPVTTNANACVRTRMTALPSAPPRAFARRRYDFASVDRAYGP
jgi:hypothetical protein